MKENKKNGAVILDEINAQEVRNSKEAIKAINKAIAMLKPLQNFMDFEDIKFHYKNYDEGDRRRNLAKISINYGAEVSKKAKEAISSLKKLKAFEDETIELCQQMELV